MFSVLGSLNYWFVAKIVLLLIFILLISIVASVFVLRKHILNKKFKSNGQQDILQVGIFHPYCNAGGGGERVLWCAVRALQHKYGSKIHIKIYTGDTNVSAEEILRNVKRVFNFVLDETNIDFVFLRKRYWVEAERYPHFTLLLQSLGSMVLGVEALLQYQPDIYIDTMGYAFTYPIFRYLGDCKVGSYTHYPIVSTDMLRRVKKRVSAHNNQSYVTKNPFLTWLKLTYYRIFAKMYGCVGRSALTVMVNSSWTEKHILDLWQIPFKTHRVYPPCEVSHLKNLEHIESDKIIIMSVGQFRPEKDHPLQLQAMYELRTLLGKDEALWEKLKLVIIGSCRGKEDEERKKSMEDLTKHLSLENSVEIKANISYAELIQNYKMASIGLHTMWNEHFGIGVVECMAAGLITVAHRSGGPLMDIIETSEGSQTGYLATDDQEYANCIANILYNTEEENQTIRNAARASSDRFSEEEFHNNFLHATSLLFND
ncbi:GDP-Man:Man(3)GlcNAc(2)-PP-Dol alpha-1,2-mannosyltransferase [Contarinia nasturtii]|uniref:GDP-Man:Man(3)GlcNAc(2)-PP-Dol alpha-1,2-mannosyltransferase n=1 Tax=Contarinia nasturtii TaxID=265458 RepID=UPI0012D467F9|nr:GDP-Man:Man(3)GlcNAc(2)-PP-Dol alpha-1,2-mannosyltransferase [Contarinia nasturtii]